MNPSVIQHKPNQGAGAWRSLFFFLFMCEDMRNKSGVDVSASDYSHLLALQHVTIFGFCLTVREILWN